MRPDWIAPQAWSTISAHIACSGLPKVYDLSQIMPEDFESLCGCELPLANTEYSLKVQSIERLRSPSPRPAPFSVTLLAPVGTRGDQGIYTLVHPTLGALELFLVPMEPRDGHSRFELVFN